MNADSRQRRATAAGRWAEAVLRCGVAWGLAACQTPSDELRHSAPGDSVPAPAFEVVGAPVLSTPADTLAFGVRQLTVSTSAPTTATVHVDDPCGRREVAFVAPGTDHVLDLRGLHLGAANQVELVLTDEGGGQRVLDLGQVTPPAPVGLPRVDVYAHDPERMEPGLIVLAPVSNRGTSWLLAVDEALHVVFALPAAFEDVRLHEGQWLGLRDGQGVLLDAYGRDLVTLGRPAGGLNHELLPTDDGDFLVLDHNIHSVADYPTDPEATSTGRSLILSQAIERYAADRSRLEHIDLVDLLPTSVVGYKSTEADDVLAKDWTHANALIPYGDDAYLVSVRHLDVVAAVGRDGALRWLLGDPTGWPPPYEELFLEPVGSLQWPRHQHALELQPDGETLVMFDNGNFGGSPRNPPPADYVEVSRGVAFRIDEAAGTVEQLWEQRHEGLFTYAMGDADVLPHTGMVQLVFSRVAAPNLHTRLVQVPVEGGAPALDLAVGLDVPRWTYRATVVPSLYGPEAVEQR